MKAKLAAVVLALVLAFALISASFASSGPFAANLEGDQGQADSTMAAFEESEGVFVWTSGGGCNFGQRGCTRYVVARDGAVQAFYNPRLRFDGPSASGNLDPLLVEAWIDAVDKTDIRALVERAGPPSPLSNVAYDGVAFVLAAPQSGVRLSSAEMKFSPEEPFFATALALSDAAAEAAPLPRN